MLMQIANDIKQLGEETVCILTGLEIAGMFFREYFQVLAIDIFRQQIVLTL